MKRVIALVIVVLLAFYVGWPAWSGYQLKAALDRKDVATVAQQVGEGEFSSTHVPIIHM